MKAIKTLFFVVILTLLNITSVMADEPNPPAPGSTARGASTNSTPGGGNPGFPIDENLVVLTVAGLFLGITVLYKNKIKKASI